MPETDTSITSEPPRRQRLFPKVLLAALLMTLAFPPADLGFLAWVGLAPLFYVLPQARRPRHAFALGYLFGYAHWGTTVIWIGTTVSAWTHSPVGWVAWVGLVAVKSGWFGLFGWAAWWLSRKTEGVRRVLAFAAAWTIMEWLRCQTGVAMPWSLTGYTQYRCLPLIQAAEIGGVFAVTLGLTLVSAGLAEAWSQRMGQRWRPLAPGAAYFTLLAIYGLATVGRNYDGTPYRLALMQPNERSFRDEKPPSEDELVGNSVARLARLSARAADARADLVVWPESAVPRSPVADADLREAAGNAARTTGSWHLLGAGHEDAKGNSYNSAFLFRPDGAWVERYDKTWLVPFGEWVPLRGVLPFDSVFHFPSDVTPGSADAVVPAGRAKMSVLICYESVFPIVSRSRVSKGANILVSITNDSWAGESSELQQHIAMAAFRAVETRRYLASSATTGITALISPNGKIEAIPPYREDLLIAEARLREGRTPYVLWGDWLVGVCALWIVLVLLRRNSGASAQSAQAQSQH